MAAPDPPRYRHSLTLAVQPRVQDQPKPIISTIKFSSNGAMLAAATNQGTINVWKTEAVEQSISQSSSQSPSQSLKPSNIQPVVLSYGESGISDLSWSYDSKLLCAASDDKTLGVFDIETGSAIRVLRGHAHCVSCCVFVPGDVIVSGSWDETVKLWDLRSGKPARTLNAHSDPVCSVSTNREGTNIVSGAYDGLCRVWDFASAQCLKTIYPEEGSPPVSSVKFTPNGKFLLTSYLDNTIKLWNYEKGVPLKIYQGHQNEKFCLFNDFCVTHKRKYIVTGSEDGFVYMFDIQSRAVVQKLSVEGQVNAPLLKHGCLAVSCHPTAHLIASSSAMTSTQNEIHVWSDPESELVIEQPLPSTIPTPAKSENASQD